MTENEAKNKLDSLHHRILNTSFCKKVYESEVEALCMAKDVLEEIQQYRAIGTVEQLKWCKDASHWKELFKEKLAKYEAIGTVEEFKALKEMSVAKKPIDKIMYLECPTCGDVGILDCGYCSACGQKLDWQ